MTDYSQLVIKALDPTHDRPGFRCGVHALDAYVVKQAKQHIKRRISRVFVATLPETPIEVTAYDTLSALSIELSQLPPVLSRKLPRHPVPAALIGRLAVNQSAHGQGIGRMLLIDAIKRTLSVSTEIAIYAVVVDAIDGPAQRFHEQFGFTSLSVDSARLWLPLKSI